MLKELAAHAQYVNDLLEDGATVPKHIFDYHVARVRDFQHERLFHLLVTLFFGLLVIVVTALVLTITVSTTVTLMLVAILALLLVTELWYVGYYYRLENGVQKLYGLTAALGERLSPHR